MRTRVVEHVLERGRRRRLRCLGIHRQRRPALCRAPERRRCALVVVIRKYVLRRRCEVPRNCVEGRERRLRVPGVWPLRTQQRGHRPEQRGLRAIHGACVLPARRQLRLGVRPTRVHERALWRWPERRHGPRRCLCAVVARRPRVRHVCGMRHAEHRLARLAVRGLLAGMSRHPRRAVGVCQERRCDPLSNDLLHRRGAHDVRRWGVQGRR